MADNSGVLMINNNNKPRKKTKGKSKVPMELIRDPKSRFVSFSKREKGLFKKLDFLSSSFPSDIEMVAIVFSPTGKPFSFGCPSTEAITACFLGRDDNFVVGEREIIQKKKIKETLTSSMMTSPPFSFKYYRMSFRLLISMLTWRS
ncbi:agamous-like MADS-box protein AGL29 [Spinacia oleracea]|uniref:Agamous-like MADS-box protein AGL29 n=1 Tax=Spinacia oleracea TaxID=3562 RepID=A0ABM3RI92_SPIOL|nr:agamous-like MADS-box protein AGL29 [Spinacia oleracea]